MNLPHNITWLWFHLWHKNSRAACLSDDLTRVKSSPVMIGNIPHSVIIIVVIDCIDRLNSYSPVTLHSNVGTVCISVSRCVLIANLCSCLLCICSYKRIAHTTTQGGYHTSCTSYPIMSPILCFKSFSLLLLS